MLPIVLVLLVATSAWAAPTVSLTQKSINEVAPPQSKGRLIDGYLVERAFELIDGGDANIYILTLERVMEDMASTHGDASSQLVQAYGIGQTLAVLTQVSTGISGDACAAASVINAYVDALRSGNPCDANDAVINFIQHLVSGIDLIVQLGANPNSVRFSVGPRGSCSRGGRIYEFEGAWDSVLASVPSGSASLLNEAYCTSKRLYNAFNSRSNNVGAYATAAALPPINQIFQSALEPVARFLAAVGSGNASGAASAAKKALIRAANNVQY